MRLKLYRTKNRWLIHSKNGQAMISGKIIAEPEKNSCRFSYNGATGLLHTILSPSFLKYKFQSEEYVMTCSCARDAPVKNIIWKIKPQQHPSANFTKLKIVEITSQRFIMLYSTKKIALCHKLPPKHFLIKMIEPDSLPPLCLLSAVYPLL
ncbi:MAG: hypothetical protein U9O98_01015 [Asgard group archaeon]|nr:hypothetical protein [Asgard group archaeon]